MAAVLVPRIDPYSFCKMLSSQSNHFPWRPTMTFPQITRILTATVNSEPDEEKLVRWGHRLCYTGPGQHNTGTLGWFLPARPGHWSCHLWKVNHIDLLICAGRKLSRIYNTHFYHGHHLSLMFGVMALFTDTYMCSIQTQHRVSTQHSAMTGRRQVNIKHKISILANCKLPNTFV